MKKIIALLLTLVMVLPMIASCAFAEEKPRHIVIGLWWDKYYDSTHETIDEDPGYMGNEADQMRFDIVAEVEEKYNVTLEYVNLTYAGNQESINTSILAGTPECDIYLVDMAMGVPAAKNGYAVDMKTILEDTSKLDDEIMGYWDLGDGAAYLFKPKAAQTIVEGTYPLMFNLQMLEDANLEDPRDLYARGEWTWDKFIEYCKALTQDTDGDGTIDVYGFGGFHGETFTCLCMSNGTYVAANETENWTSPEVGEVLQLMQDLYVTHNVAYPYDTVDPSTTMRAIYRDQKVAFSPGAAWILGNQADYDWDGSAGSTLEFDMVFVQWPVGPSGNQETNKAKLGGSGEYYMIPVGVEDPELVFNVFYDFSNYYHGDVSIRDDRETMDWWYSVTAKEPEIQDSNYEVMFDIGMREQFEQFDALQVYPDWAAFFNGDYTPAQFQETYKQEIQDAITRINGN